MDNKQVLNKIVKYLKSIGYTRLSARTDDDGEIYTMYTKPFRFGNTIIGINLATLETKEHELITIAFSNTESDEIICTETEEIYAVYNINELKRVIVDNEQTTITQYYFNKLFSGIH